MMKEQVRAVAVQHEPRPLTPPRGEPGVYPRKTLAEQAAAGAELVVFPEVGITSFFRHEADGFRTYWNEGAIDPDGPELARVCAAAARHGLHVVVGFAERGDCVGKIYNSAALIGPEGLIGISRKIHMPGVEKLYFTPGRAGRDLRLRAGAASASPFCYDTFFPEVTRQHFLQEADILVFSSSIWRGGGEGRRRPGRLQAHALVRHGDHGGAAEPRPSWSPATAAASFDLGAQGRHLGAPGAEPDRHAGRRGAGPPPANANRR